MTWEGGVVGVGRMEAEEAEKERGSGEAGGRRCEGGEERVKRGLAKKSARVQELRL